MAAFWLEEGRAREALCREPLLHNQLRRAWCRVSTPCGILRICVFSFSASVTLRI